MVRVTSTDEAATVVRFAACHKIPFTVKGGGYSTTGASITHGGIVLDLSNLRRVHVNPVSRIVTAQGGALWEDIDVAAAQHKLAVVGSTLNHIGVAGATLGGGYGWLTGQHGLAIDNLLWARMILADGSVIIVSEEQHPDLFWAIRGAGQSFGVAIELAFRAHRQDHPVFAGTLLFSADNFPAIVEFANKFEILTDGNQGFWFGFAMPSSMDRCAIFVAVFYNGAETAARHFFSPLFSIGPLVNETGMMPYDSLNGILNIMDTMSRCRVLKGADITLPSDESVGTRKSLRGSNITLPLDINFVASIYSEFDGILREIPQARDSILLFELLPNTQITKIPNDATAFASRGSYHNATSLFRWHDADLDERMHSLQGDIMNQIGTGAGIACKPFYNVSKHGTGLYANYAGTLIRAIGIIINLSQRILKKIVTTNKIAGHDLPMEAIFGDHLPRLRELKKKYDPNNMFKKWHNLNTSTITRDSIKLYG
jgi:hypothetical protein